MDIAHSPRNGKLHHISSAGVWVLAILASLTVAASAALVIYLHSFEVEQARRSQAADTLWLEENMRFHLRRLEQELQKLGQSVADSGKVDAESSKTSPLISQVVIAHGYLRRAGEIPVHLRGVWSDFHSYEKNAEAIDGMLDVVQGLGRPAYAGPMHSSLNKTADVVWMAIPVSAPSSEGAVYVAAMSLEKLIQMVVPWWFLKGHRIEVVNDGVSDGLDGDHARPEGEYLASIDMPGSDTYLQIRAIGDQPTSTPRAILAVALLFLLGTVFSLALLYRDIRRRIVAEQSLARQVAFRHSMEDAVDIGLFAIDHDGQMFYANRAYEEMVGRRVAEGDAGAPELVCPSDAGLDGASEVTYQSPSGPLRLEIRSFPLIDGDKRFGTLCTVMDVTKQREAESTANAQRLRLETASRLMSIGEVASTLAHELNQPLGALASFSSGLVNRLEKGNIGLDQVHAIALRIYGSAERAGSIISRVNAFVRRRELKSESLNLEIFFENLLAVHRREAGHLSFSYVGEPVAVNADPILLELAMHNLLLNATQATPDGGEIEIAVRCPDAHTCEVSVSDTGEGIANEDMEQLFDPFYSTKRDGMGMGLAITRSVIEALRGNIEVVCPGPLGGATFKVTLPRTEFEQ